MNLIKQMLKNASLVGNDRLNLTCTFSEGLPYPQTTTYKSTDPVSKINLFSIIFFCACLAAISLVCTGWSVYYYAQRWRTHLKKKKLRKALALSVQELLDKSPVVEFDGNSTDREASEQETPTCAICLETCKAKDTIRKLGRITT